MKLSRETYCGYGRAEPVRVEGDVEHEERPESVRRRKEPVHRVLANRGHGCPCEKVPTSPGGAN